MAGLVKALLAGLNYILEEREGGKSRTESE